MLAARCTRLLLPDALRWGASTSSHTFRTFSSTPVALKYDKDKDRVTRKPRNEEIKYKFVQCVDPETDKLTPVEPLAAVLARTNRKTHFIELVQLDPPVVKAQHIQEFREAQKAIRAKRRATKVEQKEVQMTWNVAQTDLAHKLKKARDQLLRGNLVDVAFAPKANQLLPHRRDMLSKLEQVMDTLGDIAMERREWTLERGIGVVYLRLDKSKVDAKTKTENEPEILED
ncbi:hypothetical protein M0805_007068 [Coniferiporia weirii]|nr:hypothetical protein M0805_007068 [Coniferiporia weirii]